MPNYNDLSPEERSRKKALLAQRLEKPKAEITMADWQDQNRTWKYASLVFTSLDAGLRPCDDEMKEELLPEVAKGETSIQPFGLTEPNSGSDSSSLETFAERDGDEFSISGQKIWTSRVDVSDYLVLMARTSPKKDVEKPTRGISMFLVDIEDAKAQGALELSAIPKTASNFVHSFEV